MKYIDLKRLRTRIIPTWASLRSIGNSRAVQASAVFPIIGYLILLSSQFTSLFDGGLLGETHHRSDDAWGKIWELKLYFVYFGLLYLGAGSGLYQLRCPRQIKKHGDWEDYARVDGLAMSPGFIQSLCDIIDISYSRLMIANSDFTAVRNECLRKHYAVLSAESKYSRGAVALCFAAGLFLLSIPSIMTVLKIMALLIRRG